MIEVTLGRDTARNAVRRVYLALSVTACAVVVAPTASAAAPFEAKTVSLIVGSGPGGGYDDYARLVARHLGDHLPGRPTIVASNMPGASGIQAANYLATLAPKDGSVIATFNKAVPFYQAVGHGGRFNAEDFAWIGCLSQSVDVVTVWHTAGVRSIEDAKHKTVVVGALSRIGTMWSNPALLNALLGTKFKIVTGYESGTAINRAMEQGELEGRGSNSWNAWKATAPDWVRDKKIIPLVQIGLKKDRDLGDVPLLTELAQNDEQRRLFAFASAQSIDRPFAGPPGLDAETLMVFRRAFDEMVSDRAFLDDAQRLGLDLDPLPGTKVADIVRAIVQTPAEVVRKFKELTE